MLKVATGRIAAATQINPLYSPCGARVCTHGPTQVCLLKWHLEPAISAELMTPSTQTDTQTHATLSVAINTCWKPVIDTSLCFWLYGVLTTDLSDMPSVLYTFSALTLLVGRQEEHLAYKKVEWWFLVGSEVQIVCMWSSWCHCVPTPHHLLPHFKPAWFYLAGTSLPRLSWNRGC